MKTYTVIALYEDSFQRYADSVDADSPADAERIAQENAPEPILVAGVVEGEHMCVDTDRGCSADPCMCGVYPS